MFSAVTCPFCGTHATQAAGMQQRQVKSCTSLKAVGHWTRCPSQHVALTLLSGLAVFALKHRITCGITGVLDSGGPLQMAWLCQCGPMAAAVTGGRGRGAAWPGSTGLAGGLRAAFCCPMIGKTLWNKLPFLISRTAWDFLLALCKTRICRRWWVQPPVPAGNLGQHSSCMDSGAPTMQTARCRGSAAYRALLSLSVCGPPKVWRGSS